MIHVKISNICYSVELELCCNFVSKKQATKHSTTLNQSRNWSLSWNNANKRVQFTNILSCRFHYLSKWTKIQYAEHLIVKNLITYFTGIKRLCQFSPSWKVVELFYCMILVAGTIFTCTFFTSCQPWMIEAGSFFF